MFHNFSAIFIMPLKNKHDAKDASIQVCKLAWEYFTFKLEGWTVGFTDSDPVSWILGHPGTTLFHISCLFLHCSIKIWWKFAWNPVFSQVDVFVSVIDLPFLSNVSYNILWQWFVHWSLRRSPFHHKICKSIPGLILHVFNYHK